MLPLTANRSFTVKPEKLLSEVLKEDASFTVDQVAEFIVREDNTFQLIDLRVTGRVQETGHPRSCKYPLSLNSLRKIRRHGSVIKTSGISSISAEDTEADYALVYARGLGYDNSFVMEGGITEWITTVMETKFTGDRITARENALFETRRRAGEMFTELNSLPDSLKIKFLESKKFSAKKLDGGCE